MYASMASFLLVNGAKGKKYILPDAEVMIYEVSGYFMGKLTEMQDKLKHSKSLNFKLWKNCLIKLKNLCLWSRKTCLEKILG